MAKFDVLLCGRIRKEQDIPLNALSMFLAPVLDAISLCDERGLMLDAIKFVLGNGTRFVDISLKSTLSSPWVKILARSRENAKITN